MRGSRAVQSRRPLPLADDSMFLGASGTVMCLDALKGDVRWEKNLQKEYPGSEIYPSSPLIEGDLLILLVGAKPGASVIAFDKNTGKQIWNALDDGPTASSPIVLTAAGVRQLIVWTDRSVTSLAPATGKTLWRERLHTTQDAAVSTPVYHDGYLLIGGLMMKLDQDKPNAVVLWPESRATAQRVLSDTSTPLFRDGYVYSARSFGEFVCLDAKTGKQLWETDKVTDRKSGASVHPTENGKSVLLYNDRGELIRAHGGWAVGADQRSRRIINSSVFADTSKNDRISEQGFRRNRSSMRPTSAQITNFAEERLPEECCDESARHGHGRVGRITEPDGPRHRCAHCR